MPSKIIVSRNWNKPEIEAFMNTESVGAACSVSDFIDILADEIGNPTLLVTRAQLKAKMLAGWSKLETELKNATRYV